MTTTKAQQIATSAKEKVQIAWTSLRSLTIEDGDAARCSLQQRLKKVIEVDPKAENAWDSMVKAMFGSCTAGIPEETQSPLSLTSRSSKSVESAGTISPTREKEEFFYSQFMNKDRTRAHKAVSAVLSLKERKPNPPPKATSVPKPFPVSSPARKEDSVPPILVREIIPPKNASGIENGLSFDDGISAISAHTLEELVREEEMKRGIAQGMQFNRFAALKQNQSKESSLFSLSHTSPEKIEEGKDKLGQPIYLSRGNSRTSKRSYGTRSTRSTHTSEFESTWRRDERKYWQDVAEREGSDTGCSSTAQGQAFQVQRAKDIRRLRSREGVRKLICKTSLWALTNIFVSQDLKDLPHVQTQTTASSSLYSGTLFTKSHPHETFLYEAEDVVNVFEENEIITRHIVYAGYGRKDPDRLQEVLLLTHDTELAEI